MSLPIKTTDNKAVITGVAAVSAALAFVTIKAIEHIFDVKLNAETAPVMGSVTVLWHAALTYLGVTDEPKQP